MNTIPFYHRYFPPPLFTEDGTTREQGECDVLFENEGGGGEKKIGEESQGSKLGGGRLKGRRESRSCGGW